MTDTARYPKTVFWSEENEGYIAIAADLPGASAFGETQAEALAQLDDAIVAWIEAAQAAGNPVPAPSDPVRRQGFSGKVLLRLPKSLHEALSIAAEADGVS